MKKAVENPYSMEGVNKASRAKSTAAVFGCQGWYRLALGHIRLAACWHWQPQAQGWGRAGWVLLG